MVYGCWKNDTSILDYVAANNISSYDELLGIFVSRMDDYILNTLDAIPVHWEEVFKAGIKTDPRTIFQVWTDQTQIQSVVQAKYSVIASPSDVWYLEYVACVMTILCD